MSNAETIRVGISTCPNDTFAFHGLMHGLVDRRGLDFQVELLDIQQLNDRLLGGDFDIAKTSFHAALLLTDRCVVLRCGAALGFGVGPLLLSARCGETPQGRQQLTLCPGHHTTATLLLRLFHGQVTRVEQVVFSEIMPRLCRGEADFGVCIHEGRFTWQQHGLGLVEDLGTRWEQATGCPLPLGGLVARDRLSAETLGRAVAAIRDSICWGLEHRDATLPTMRRWAREFDDRVLLQHVDLYVNRWTIDLEDVGTAALQALAQQARRAGVIDQDVRLRCFGDPSGNRSSTVRAPSLP